ncbi:MAG: hypothetical protein L0154_10510 [Chloroflexi bacterium]|nr:hypothetical protein [Chloroflexota bacterium]
MESITLAQFKQRLLETVTWCLSVMSMDSVSLRTPPDVNGSVAEQYKAVVHKQTDVILFRPELDENPLAGGRLLFVRLIDPADNTASTVTEGFFDFQNLPPWDTWVYYSEDGFLLCWIPRPLVAVVQPAIDGQNIAWLDGLEELAPFREMLRSEGIVD